MYVLMFTCMCVAAEYRKEGLQKTKQRLQRNCALTMHYLKKTLKTKKKKREKKKKHTLGQFPLPTDFTFCCLSISGQMAQHTVTRLRYPAYC